MRTRPFQLFIFACLFLCHEISAQPTCESNFSAFETCSIYYSLEYVFVGRVRNLASSPAGNGLTPLLKANVEVELRLKGQLPKEVDVTMRDDCFGVIEAGKTFIFTAQRRDGLGSSQFFSYKWSTPIDELSPNDKKKIIAEIRSVLRGEPQARIVGTVVEQDWNRDASYRTLRSASDPKFGYNVASARPLAGVVVIAEDDRGRQFKTLTGTNGYYKFYQLPAGRYAVRPSLNRTLDVYSNGILLNAGQKHYISVGDKQCSKEVNFDLQETGSIEVRLERARAHWKSHPQVRLHRVVSSKYPLDSDVNRDLFRSEIRPTHSRSEDTTGTRFQIIFERVPAGSYVLAYDIDPQQDFSLLFYPVARSLQTAKLITVVNGEWLNLEIKVPLFQERTFWGTVTTPDGKPAEAVMELIDDTAPFETIVLATARDGIFNFQVWKNRPFTVYAYYLGRRNGQQVRFVKRMTGMVLNEDTGPLSIVLDQIEPY